MIRTRKQQLFRNYILPLVFFLSLPGFFFHFLKFEPKFLPVFRLSLFLLILGLYYLLADFRRRERLILLQREDAEERTNLINVKIKEEEKSLKAFDDKIGAYSSLGNVCASLNSCLTLQDTADTLCSMTCDILGDEDRICILYLFESKTRELAIISANKGKNQEMIKPQKGDIFDQWIIKKLQPLRVEDIKRDFRFDLEKIEEEQSRPIRSLISVSLIVGKKVVGVLRLESPREYSFSDDDLRILSALADLGAVAIENALLYQSTEELAIKDGLTGLYLRRFLLERLNEETQRSLRSGASFSLLMIDIDKFKDYNDKFGHMAGDIVLKSIALVLLGNFSQPGNVISRYGGEEFLVLLADSSKDRAQKLAEDLRVAIKERDIVLRKKHTRVTVSIGVSSFPEDSKTIEDLIGCADSALYAAKKGGRDKVCIWH